MAFINLLHNGYQGKLGETVGQKWKNQRTVRTYNPHNNSKSEAQSEQREFYKQAIKYASEVYSTSRNLLLPPNTPMNKFNFVSSYSSKLLDGTIRLGRPTQFMGLKNTSIIFPYGLTLNGDPILYINDPLGRIEKKISAISVHVMFSIDANSDTALPFEGLDPLSVYDKSMIGRLNNIPTSKGFAIKLSPLSNGNAMVIGYVTIKVGKQRIFSQTMPLSPIINSNNANWVDN